MAALQSLAGNYAPGVEASSAAAAEEHARKAIALDAGLAEPWAVLGNLYGRQRRFVEAFDTFQRALAIDPNDVTANFWNAALLCQLGYLARCDAGLDKVLQLDPMLPNALSWRGRAYVREGNLDAGGKMLERSKDAGLAHAGMALADLAEARGNLPEAERLRVQGYAPFMGGFPPGSNEVLVHSIFGDAAARAAALAVIERYLAGNPRRWPFRPCCAWIPARALSSARMPRPAMTRCFSVHSGTTTNPVPARFPSSPSLRGAPAWRGSGTSSDRPTSAARTPRAIMSVADCPP